jgi:hypothetical protein
MTTLTTDLVAAVYAAPNLLTEAGLNKVRQNLAMTRADSPYRAEFEQEVAEAEARWAAEAEVRAAKAELARYCGLTRKETRSGERIWIVKFNGRWIERPTLDQVVQAAGL